MARLVEGIAALGLTIGAACDVDGPTALPYIGLHVHGHLNPILFRYLRSEELDGTAG